MNNIRKKILTKKIYSDVNLAQLKKMIGSSFNKNTFYPSIEIHSDKNIILSFDDDINLEKVEECINIAFKEFILQLNLDFSIYDKPYGSIFKMSNTLYTIHL